MQTDLHLLKRIGLRSLRLIDSSLQTLTGLSLLMLTGLSLLTLTDWHWPKLIHLRLLMRIGLRSLKQTD